jgi:hypothetical protein
LEILPRFDGVEVNYRSTDDPYLTVYKNLACAEALRRTGHADGALTRFHEVIKISNLYGYQLEKAHALLGIAATKLLRKETDRQSCNQALKLYQKLGSTWGQAQALVTQALMESEMGESTAHLLQRATQLAHNKCLH